MAFKFNVNPIAAEPVDRLDLLQAQEELNQAFMDLTDAQKSMTEVCEVMENIQTSVDLITKYGAAGVEQLNVDGSLEALCGAESKLLTAEKAMEGLGEAAKELWNKFIGFMKNLFTKLINVVTKFIPDKFAAVKAKLEGLRSNKATESLAATEGIKLSVYCDNFVDVVKTTFKHLDTVRDGITHVYNSLDALSKQPADVESKDSVKNKLEAIVFGKDSYFSRVKDAFSAIEEINRSGHSVNVTEFDDTVLSQTQLNNLVSIVDEAVERCKPFQDMLMKYSRNVGSMEARGKNYEQIGDSDQVAILRIFVTGFSGCVSDIQKAMFVFNAIASRTSMVANKVTQIVG